MNKNEKLKPEFAKKLKGMEKEPLVEVRDFRKRYG